MPAPSTSAWPQHEAHLAERHEMSCRRKAFSGSASSAPRRPQPVRAPRLQHESAQDLRRRKPSTRSVAISCCARRPRRTSYSRREAGAEPHSSRRSGSKKQETRGTVCSALRNSLARPARHGICCGSRSPRSGLDCAGDSPSAEWRSSSSGAGTSRRIPARCPRFRSVTGAAGIEDTDTVKVNRPRSIVLPSSSSHLSFELSR